MFLALTRYLLVKIDVMVELNDCFSLNDIARKIYGKANYTNREKVKKYLAENNIEWQEWLADKKRGVERYCLVCGKVLVNEQKKFCSYSCSAKYNNCRRKKKETKHCIYCGKEINNSRKKTLFCSNNCQKNFEYEEFLTKWKNGELDGSRGNKSISNHIRRYLLEKTNNSCEICGCNWVNPKSGKPIVEVHHIDGNAFNNKEENLQVLCPNHHAMTHNYKHNNKNGRTKRLKTPSSHSG